MDAAAECVRTGFNVAVILDIRVVEIIAACIGWVEGDCGRICFRIVNDYGGDIVALQDEDTIA